MTRYAYLGPEGSFTEAALHQHVERAGAESAGAESGDAERTDDVLLPYKSVPAALDAVRSGEADAAMVPFENSVEGSVAVTLDELSSGAEAPGGALMIRGEVVLPVSFGLLVRPGTAMTDIRTAGGHPHALPQFRRWFEANLPGVEWQPAASNSQAARDVAEGRWDAAFARPAAAEIYGLEVLAQDIHDTEGAETRFVLVGGPQDDLPAPTGADKTSFVVYIGEDHAGALLEILTELAVRGVNLNRIESRPTRAGLGSYCFSVDAEGHVADARVGEALVGLRRVCADVRFLGSYPRADGRAPMLRSGVTDAEFSDAQAWLARMREGRP